jgi:hypothetical protein
MGLCKPLILLNKGSSEALFEGLGELNKLGNGAFAQPSQLTNWRYRFTRDNCRATKALDNYVRSLGVPLGPPQQGFMPHRSLQEILTPLSFKGQ